MKDLRIFISGCSGVGKTTLCKAMAELMGIPYVNTSASKLWDMFGIKSHEEALELGPSDAIRYQALVHDQRVNELRKVNGPLITDRGAMDQLIYLSDYRLNPESRDILIQDIMEDFYQDLINYNCLFVKLIRPFDWQTEYNGKRITDEFYQVSSNMKYSGFDFRLFLKKDVLNKYYVTEEVGSPLVYLKRIGSSNPQSNHPLIYMGGIYTKVLKKRMQGILQLLVNSKNMDEYTFNELYKQIEMNEYDPKRYI